MVAGHETSGAFFHTRLGSFRMSPGRWQLDKALAEPPVMVKTLRRLALGTSSPHAKVHDENIGEDDALSPFCF
jgi:hypothetical protein